MTPRSCRLDEANAKRVPSERAALGRSTGRKRLGARSPRSESGCSLDEMQLVPYLMCLVPTKRRRPPASPAAE
jgi:hypothetical protein